MGKVRRGSPGRRGPLCTALPRALPPRGVTCILSLRVRSGRRHPGSPALSKGSAGAWCWHITACSSRLPLLPAQTEEAAFSEPRRRRAQSATGPRWPEASPVQQTSLLSALCVCQGRGAGCWDWAWGRGVQMGSGACLPLPLCPRHPLCHLTPSWPASPLCAQTRQRVFGDRHPCFRGASGFANPLLVVRLPNDPKGLACKTLFSGLCVFPVCSTLPVPPGSGPSASPCLSLQTQVSCVCRQSRVSQWGPGRRRDISRELWGRRLGGQRRLSDSRDSASSSRGLGQAPGASGCGW